MVPASVRPPQDPPTASRPPKARQGQFFFSAQMVPFNLSVDPWWYAHEIYNVPLEPERAAEAREARRSYEFLKSYQNKGGDPTHYTPLTSPKSYLYSITIRCFHTNGTTFLPPYNTGVDSLSFLYSNRLTFHSLYSHINFIVGKVEKCRLLKAHSSIDQVHDKYSRGKSLFFPFSKNILISQGIKRGYHNTFMNEEAFHILSVW